MQFLSIFLKKLWNLFYSVMHNRQTSTADYYIQEGTKCQLLIRIYLCHQKQRKLCYILLCWAPIGPCFLSADFLHPDITLQKEQTHTQQKTLGPCRHENNDLNLHRTDINISTFRFTRLQTAAKENLTPHLSLMWHSRKLGYNEIRLRCRKRVLSK